MQGNSGSNTPPQLPSKTESLLFFLIFFLIPTAFFTAINVWGAMFGSSIFSLTGWKPSESLAPVPMNKSTTNSTNTTLNHTIHTQIPEQIIVNSALWGTLILGGLAFLTASAYITLKYNTREMRTNEAKKFATKVFKVDTLGALGVTFVTASFMYHLSFLETCYAALCSTFGTLITLGLLAAGKFFWDDEDKPTEVVSTNQEITTEVVAPDPQPAAQPNPLGSGIFVAATPNVSPRLTSQPDAGTPPPLTLSTSTS